jgi:hypothetical protein
LVAKKKIFDFKLKFLFNNQKRNTPLKPECFFFLSFASSKESSKSNNGADKKNLYKKMNTFNRVFVCPKLSFVFCCCLPTG